MSKGDRDRQTQRRTEKQVQRNTQVEKQSQCSSLLWQATQQMSGSFRFFFVFFFFHFCIYKIKMEYKCIKYLNPRLKSPRWTRPLFLSWSNRTRSPARTKYLRPERLQRPAQAPRTADCPALSWLCSARILWSGNSQNLEGQNTYAGFDCKIWSVRPSVYVPTWQRLVEVWVKVHLGT